jgi:hypothetical protein
LRQNPLDFAQKFAQITQKKSFTTLARTGEEIRGNLHGMLFHNDQRGILFDDGRE